MNNKLIQRFVAGDKQAFTDLYEEYAEYALRVAMAITGNRMTAADAVQETFIRVYKNAQSFDSKKPFKPWFYKILVNECKRLLAKNKNTVLVDEFTVGNLLNSKSDDYHFVEYEHLYQGIRKLDDINKIPIILKYLKGFSENEIVEILDLNINTVKSRLFKGRQKLKNILGSFEGGKENEQYRG